MVSASEVLPTRSIATVSSAFISSRHPSARAFRSSTRAKAASSGWPMDVRRISV